MAILLTTSALRRAGDLSCDMEARGYPGGAGTTLSELQITSTDVAAAFLMVLFIGGVYILKGIFA